jgi:hypothetical protein
MTTTKRVETTKLFEVSDEKARRKYAYKYAPERSRISRLRQGRRKQTARSRRTSWRTKC